MTKKLLLWVGTLTLSTVAIVSAKTYELVLSTPVQAEQRSTCGGNIPTKKLKAQICHPTDTRTQKSVTVPAKVSETGTKYNSTSLDNSTQGSTVQINSIKLGGTKTVVEFGK